MIEIFYEIKKILNLKIFEINFYFIIDINIRKIDKIN